MCCRRCCRSSKTTDQSNQRIESTDQPTEATNRTTPRNRHTITAARPTSTQDQQPARRWDREIDGQKIFGQENISPTDPHPVHPLPQGPGKVVVDGASHDDTPVVV